MVVKYATHGGDYDNEQWDQIDAAIAKAEGKT